MPKKFELSGPAFVGLMVRDAEASAAFYEKILGFRRDPEAFPAGAAFLSLPVPFGLIQMPPGSSLEHMPRPINNPAIWFKANESQAVYEALVEAGVTILREPSDGRFGRQFTFMDPDGYAITIYDRNAPPDGWPSS
jgi:catechol 2,3-dioxygenase-like lactoylglutathione lyase family enzyme